MQNKSVRETVLSGLFIALGLVLPIAFHALGAGSTFLPMHIPVLLAGFTVGIPFAIAVGVITPLLSSLLTGMPPMFPIAAYMVFELAAYGAAASLLYRRLRLNVYVSLVGSMLIGRLISALAVWVLATFFAAQLPGPWVFVAGGVAGSIPGIIIQIVFIPAIIMILGKNNLIKREAL
jgi:predicted membrane protein